MKVLLHQSMSLSRSVQMSFPVHVQIPRSPFLIPFPFTCHSECGVHRPVFLFPAECQRQGKCHTKNLLPHYNRLPTLLVPPQGVVQPGLGNELFHYALLLDKTGRKGNRACNNRLTITIRLVKLGKRRGLGIGVALQNSIKFGDYLFIHTWS